MLYIKFQPQSFLVSGEEHIKCFLPYIGIATILFNGTESFNQIVKTFSTEGPFKIWLKMLHFQIGRHLKITILYM